MNLFLGVVYLEMELGLGYCQTDSAFGEGGTRLRAAAYGICS